MRLGIRQVALISAVLMFLLAQFASAQVRPFRSDHRADCTCCEKPASIPESCCNEEPAPTPTCHEQDALHDCQCYWSAPDTADLPAATMVATSPILDIPAALPTDEISSLIKNVTSRRQLLQDPGHPPTGPPGSPLSSRAPPLG